MKEINMIQRKLYLSVTWSTIRKRAKGTPDIIVKTTKVINFGFKKYVNFGKRKGEKLKKLNKNGLCIEVKNIIKSIEPLFGFCPRLINVPGSFKKQNLKPLIFKAYKALLT